jgi:hypothetical protein
MAAGHSCERFFDTTGIRRTQNNAGLTLVPDARERARAIGIPPCQFRAVPMRVEPAVDWKPCDLRYTFAMFSMRKRR